MPCNGNKTLPASCVPVLQLDTLSGPLASGEMRRLLCTVRGAKAEEILEKGLKVRLVGWRLLHCQRWAIYTHIQCLGVSEMTVPGFLSLGFSLLFGSGDRLMAFVAGA